MSVLKNAIPYSPKSFLTADLDAGADTVTIDNIDIVGDVPIYAVITTAANVDFTAEDLGLYETILIEAKTTGTSTISSITRQIEGAGELGQGRAWVTGDVIACFWTAAAYNDFKTRLEAIGPSGGTQRQFLMKDSGDDYDIAWGDPIYQGDEAPADPIDGDFWLDTSSSEYQGTTFGDLEDDINDHIANDTDAHGAVSAATASKLMVRDTDGRARVADPDNVGDIANKGWVETLAGRVVQVVTGTSTVEDTTTSTTYANTSLAATITPKYNNSVLVVMVSAHGRVAHDTSGATSDARRSEFRLYNSTNSTVITGANLVEYGAGLISVSQAEARHFTNPALMGIYTVNSTDARTFYLQFRALGTMLPVKLLGSTSTALMIILEVKV